MSSEKGPDTQVFELMWEIRKFTRSSLMLQHVIAQKAGLHVTDAECIDFLMEMGPSTAGALAKATRLTTGAITNVIDRLEKAGFVKRGPDPNDRRKVVVSHIPEKKTATSAHYGALARDVQQLLQTYDEDQLALLKKHTAALTKIFQDRVTEMDKS
jgi:DNA-binding MarR family transcriptional regulator